MNSNHKIVAVIPARMGSTRFPGKPLAPILGLSMIEHVYKRTAMCEQLHQVYVATCDEEICQAVEQFGGLAVMTSDQHERASDRVAEAALDLDAEIIVMVQGDEPMTNPRMIEQAIAPMLSAPDVQCVNLVKQIESEQEFVDPNTIKVVMDCHHNALYFSREPVPSRKHADYENVVLYKQVCIIPFRRDFLLAYSQLEPTPLEQIESIDMLRILEHGYKVRLAETGFYTHAVDTPADLEHVEQLMRDDPLTRKYTPRNPRGEVA